MGDLEAQYREYVQYMTPTKLLRKAAFRVANAVTKLNMNIDRVGKVVATIKVKYLTPTGELQVGHLCIFDFKD